MKKIKLLLLILGLTCAQTIQCSMELIKAGLTSTQQVLKNSYSLIAAKISKDSLKSIKFTISNNILPTVVYTSIVGLGLLSVYDKKNFWYQKEAEVQSYEDLKAPTFFDHSCIFFNSIIPPTLLYTGYLQSNYTLMAAGVIYAITRDYFIPASKTFNIIDEQNKIALSQHYSPIRPFIPLTLGLLNIASIFSLKPFIF